MTRKVAINTCHGGFSLSDKALGILANWTNIPIGEVDFAIACATQEIDNEFLIPRDDPNLIAVIEDLGESAHGLCAKIKIVEIPDNVDWQIQEYDGREWIAEKHRMWS